MIINQIVAIGSKREIGKEGKMLWHISEDFKRFKKIRMGYPIIMGRKTFDSIGNELKGSLNIVVTRDKNYKIEDRNVKVFHSIQDVMLELDMNYQPKQCFIIGGGEIYKETLPITDFIYITEVNQEFPEADTFYPELDPNKWVELFNEFRGDGKQTINYKLLKRK